RVRRPRNRRLPVGRDVVGALVSPIAAGPLPGVAGPADPDLVVVLLGSADHHGGPLPCPNGLASAPRLPPAGPPYPQLPVRFPRRAAFPDNLQAWLKPRRTGPPRPCPVPWTPRSACPAPSR